MLNSVNLQGRLVRDPDLREIAAGRKLATFTLAVDKAKDATDFIDCQAFDKTAETIGSYVHKGDMIVVSGRLAINLWKDKDGKNRKDYRVTVYDVNFCGGKKAETPEKPRYQQPTFEDLGGDDGELPF